MKTIKEKANGVLAWIEKQGTPQDKGEISDGYHTFNELYYYRMLYNAAFFNMLPKEWVHKSKKHHDGEDCFGGGWFIVMANLPTGQISNHYELKNWDLFQIPEKEVADKWDGHTPQEAADRLHKYLLEKQGEQKPSDEDMKEALRTEYEKGRADAFAQMQKEWSEEDVYNSKLILSTISQDQDLSLETKNKLSSWLKSIKDRVIPQSKQEWSEEDEKIKEDILYDLNTLLEDSKSEWAIKDLKKEINWLQSLRPKNQWKPSVAQMEALYEEAQKSDRIRDDRIVSIYNDLNKLKEK